MLHFLKQLEQLARKIVDRLERCRVAVLFMNFVVLLYTLSQWLWFYIKLYYYKWSVPLWRV